MFCYIDNQILRPIWAGLINRFGSKIRFLLVACVRYAFVKFKIKMGGSCFVEFWRKLFEEVLEGLSLLREEDEVP